MKLTTKEWENQIEKANNVEELKVLLSQLPERNLPARLEALCQKYHMTFSQVQVASGITKSLFYAIINGTRTAKKGHMLKIAVAMGLSVEETNEILKLAGLKELYAKNKEDAIVMFGLRNSLQATQIEELLTDAQCDLHLIER